MRKRKFHPDRKTESRTIARPAFSLHYSYVSMFRVILFTLIDFDCLACYLFLPAFLAAFLPVALAPSLLNE